jgi:hypothetical protein
MEVGERRGEIDPSLGNGNWESHGNSITPFSSLVVPNSSSSLVFMECGLICRRALIGLFSLEHSRWRRTRT